MIELNYRAEDLADMLQTVGPADTSKKLLLDAERQAASESDRRFYEMKRHYERRWEFWETVAQWGGIILSVILAVAFCVWLPMKLSDRATAFYNQQAWVCSQGRTDACSRVIESYQEATASDTSLGDYRSDAGHMALYQKLYHDRTGAYITVPTAGVR